MFSELGQLIAAVPAPATYDGALIQLYNAAVNPDPTTPLATFTPLVCTFNGYAGVAASWSVVNLSSTKLGIYVSASFVAVSPIGTPETAYGYYITNAAGTALIASEEFATPVPFASGGDFLDLNVALPRDLIGPTGLSA